MTPRWAMVTRAMGWLWLGQAAAAVVAFVWLGYELAKIIARFDVAHDGLAQIGAFVGAYGMFVAATVAVLGWALGCFALAPSREGSAASTVLLLLAAAAVFHLMPTALAHLAAFGAAPPPIARCLAGECLERPWRAFVLLQCVIALATLAWLATVRRVA